MAMASKEPREADIVLSRVDVALARSQRIIANWLPQKSSDGDKSAGPDDQVHEVETQLGRDDSESFGVGWAPEASTSDSIRKDVSNLDRLRKQILGKRASDNASKLPQRFAVGQTSMSKSIASMSVKSAPRPDSVSEDEDEGRAAAITSKKRKLSKQKNGKSHSPDPVQDSKAKTEVFRSSDENLAPADGDAEPLEKAESKATSSAVSAVKKKPANFLDEVLAEKRKKRKKQKDGPKLQG